MVRKKSKKFRELSGLPLFAEFAVPESDDDGNSEEKTQNPASEKIKKPLPELVVDSGLGSDKKTLKKLKNGKFKVEARLDLHGLKLHAAREMVASFIDDCFMQEKRWVLIITGKGKNSAAGNMTINSEFAAWLNSLDLREKIVSFTHAAPKDGGGGAFYLLLRKKRI